MDLAQLNRSVQDLQWRYCSTRTDQSVRVEGFAEVMFPPTGDPALDVPVQRWLRRKHNHGLHEPATVAALAALAPGLPADRDVLDVGALYGYFSLLAASMLPAAPIHAFEANPRSFRALQANLAANPSLGTSRLHAHQLAVSDQSSHQTKVDIQGLTLVENEGESEMDFMSIDDFCEVHGAQPSLLKVDVEGFQAKVIPGAMRTFEVHRPVMLLEFDQREKLARFSTSNKQLLLPLADLGYRLYWCANHRELEPFHEVDIKRMGRKHETNSLGVLVPGS